MSLCPAFIIFLIFLLMKRFFKLVVMQKRGVSTRKKCRHRAGKHLSPCKSSLGFCGLHFAHPGICWAFASHQPSCENNFIQASKYGDVMKRRKLFSRNPVAEHCFLPAWMAGMSLFPLQPQNLLLDSKFHCIEKSLSARLI